MPTLGAVAALDLGNADFATVDVNGVDETVIPVPKAHRLVMNSAGTWLLVFSDNYTAPCSDGSSAMTVINVSQVDMVAPGSTTSTSQNTITNLPAIVCGFNEAVWGVFGSDGHTAYILNCGKECGGTGSTTNPNGASIQAFDLNQLTPCSDTVIAHNVCASTPGQYSYSYPNATPAGLQPALAVPVATTGLLNGSTLYVAELREVFSARQWPVERVYLEHRQYHFTD